MANETNTQRGGLHSYPLRIPANGTTKRTIRGTTIRVADAPYEINITAHNKKLNNGKGTAFTLPMKKFEKWFTDIEYDEIEIENPGDNEILVTLQLGYGDFVAEILSRTVAAAVTTMAHDFVDDEGGIAEDDWIEVAIIPENLQRKRIRLIYSFAFTGDGDVEVWLGPPEVATLADLFDQGYPLEMGEATAPMGDFIDWIESTAATSIYFVAQADSITTIQYRWATFEESYLAGGEIPAPPPE